jgi:hypothetical protein
MFFKFWKQTKKFVAEGVYPLRKTKLEKIEKTKCRGGLLALPKNEM